MKALRILLSIFAVIAVSCCLTPAFAGQVPQAAYSADFAQLEADGWTETGPGVYQRSLDGRLQILAYGDAGPRIELGWIDTQLGLLNESFELDASADVALAIQDMEQRRDELLAVVRQGTQRRQVGDTSFLTQDVSGLDQVDCNPQGTYSATAGIDGDWPVAAATTTYSESCERDGTVYCASMARGYQGTVYNFATQNDGPRDVVGSGSCSVSSSVPGDNNCFATSTSQLTFTTDAGEPVQFVERNSVNTCAPPFAVTIGSTNFVDDGNGTFSYALSPGDCITSAFQATSNRAATAYTWSYDGSVSNGGTSFGEKYCNRKSQEGTTATHTLQLNGTESGYSAQQQVTVSVVYLAP